MQKIKTIEDVRASHLCTGCGACASLEPQRFAMADVTAEGRRPFVVDNAPAATGQAFAACPGVGLQHDYDVQDSALLKSLAPAWGPVYRVVEGHACDPVIRFSGSSGGAATALALFCLEKRHMHGVLHTAAEPQKPYLNRTQFSRNRTDLLAASGSRYAPSSPCEQWQSIAEAAGPCLFIGKPCDVAALRRAQKQSPALKNNTGLAIAFFCAGVPNTDATLQLARQQGAPNPQSILNLRYRGNGWPGNWSLFYSDRDGREHSSRMTYGDSWAFLQKQRQWRCYVCADHTGEFADIAVGDPWYRPIKPGEMGSSLIVARSRRGLEFLRDAVDAGYLQLTDDDPTLLPRSQPDLVAMRGNLWARLAVMRLFGAATPNYSGFAFFRFWRTELDLAGKLRSIFGTVKRIFTKKLLRPVPAAASAKAVHTPPADGAGGGTEPSKIITDEVDTHV
ncbi:hypothetical protein Maes01_02106 [Microbulbifer aestuariivivens]|uniref:Coenzyme F420 hydrogenase n=1 Tax=Microbulbifer aestuariivivens TaxID=1908308 RepID=A0ABP9WU21_9GAMM